MKKFILAVLFTLSALVYSEDIRLSDMYNNKGPWSVVIAESRSTSGATVVLVGNPYKEIRTVDIDNPSGDMYFYKDLTFLKSDGGDLDFIRVELPKDSVKPSVTTYSSLKEIYKNWERMALVSKSNNGDDEVIGIFNKKAYKDIKVFNKGNNTIVKYFDVYFIFDKGDCEFKDASAWN